MSVRPQGVRAKFAQVCCCCIPIPVIVLLGLLAVLLASLLR